MKGILLLAAVFVIFLILSPLMPEPPSAVLNYNITGCAETIDGKSTRDINEARETSGPRAFINEDIVSYHRSLDHLCCRKVIIQESLTNEVLNIYEVWTGPGCRCICHSEINATIKVPDGTYVINVYETGTDPETNEKMTPNLLLTGIITSPDSGNTSPQ